MAVTLDHQENFLRHAQSSLRAMSPCLVFRFYALFFLSRHGNLRAWPQLPTGCHPVPTCKFFPPKFLAAPPLSGRRPKPSPELRLYRAAPNSSRSLVSNPHYPNSSGSIECSTPRPPRPPPPKPPAPPSTRSTPPSVELDSTHACPSIHPQTTAITPNSSVDQPNSSRRPHYSAIEPAPLRPSRCPPPLGSGVLELSWSRVHRPWERPLHQCQRSLRHQPRTGPRSTNIGKARRVPAAPTPEKPTAPTQTSTHSNDAFCIDPERFAAALTSEGFGSSHAGFDPDDMRSNGNDGDRDNGGDDGCDDVYGANGCDDMDSDNNGGNEDMQE